ncbi:chondroitin sulfate proteoglycan 5 isoform X1 [Tachysurus ichikawai]
MKQFCTLLWISVLFKRFNHFHTPGQQDDPNSQNKLEDAVKSPPPKEDDSLNIQNSLTPKHENHKVLGEENSSEVNSLQNNMM